MQPQGHWQVLSNIIDFGMNLQEAGDAARVRHSPSRQPGGTLAVEPGVPDAVVDELRRRGHHVVRSGGGIMGGYQAIMIDPETGMLHGGSDPRKDGQAVGLLDESAVRRRFDGQVEEHRLVCVAEFRPPKRQPEPARAARSQLAGARGGSAP